MDLSCMQDHNLRSCKCYSMKYNAVLHVHLHVVLLLIFKTNVLFQLLYDQILINSSHQSMVRLVKEIHDSATDILTGTEQMCLVHRTILQRQ